MKTRSESRETLRERTQNPLTESEEQILVKLSGGSVPVGELKEQIEEVRKLIGEGLIRMAIVQYVWGIEFNIELTHRGRAYVTERFDS